MRSIILVFFFMWLISCKTPTGAEEYYDYEYGSNRPIDYDYYAATILVKYENGNPCTTSHVTLNNSHSWHADSNGAFYVYTQKIMDINNPETHMAPCIVYKDTSPFVNVFKNVIWIGDIELTIGGAPYAYPDLANPNLVVVIPDSPLL